MTGGMQCQVAMQLKAHVCIPQIVGAVNASNTITGPINVPSRLLMGPGPANAHPRILQVGLPTGLQAQGMYASSHLQARNHASTDRLPCCCMQAQALPLLGHLHPPFLVRMAATVSHGPTHGPCALHSLHVTAQR